MINLAKSKEFFNPEDVKAPIHIIGCGAVGASIAELLTRAGLKRLHLWDFDVVESHNIANQLFTQEDVGKEKTVALSEYLMKINDELKIIKHEEWTNQPLQGYVFLAVDNIDVRREIVKNNSSNPYIKAFFDVRMGLTSGTIYAANAAEKADIERMLATMNYTHEEAKKETPVSACGFELSVAPTVRALTAFQVSNFMNFIRTNKLIKFGQLDAFQFFTDFH